MEATDLETNPEAMESAAVQQEIRKNDFRK
jgi:hypothetical protein